MKTGVLNMKKEPVQIIYLNGASSSGKTTIAKALQNAFEEPFLHVGIDKIIGWMPEKVNDWTGKEAPIGYSWKKSEDESGNLIQELQIGHYAQKDGGLYIFDINNLSFLLDGNNITSLTIDWQEIVGSKIIYERRLCFRLLRADRRAY